MSKTIRGVATVLAILLAPVAVTATEQLADAPYTKGYLSPGDVAKLQDELVYQRAVQTYLWALPALNIYGMKEGSEAKFGKGYNILPIFKKRLDAKTLITTPNSDVIYALGYLDLKEDGPMVIEVPPGLQGIIDDFFQRPIPSEGEIDGRKWAGDVGLPGPDKGKGGKYLILPPDYTGDIPEGYFTYRSGTYGVFVFWRGFFNDPKQLDAPVKVMEQTKIYPFGKETSAKNMEFPDASGHPGQGLFHNSAPLRPDQGLLRSDVEAGRYREDQDTLKQADPCKSTDRSAYYLDMFRHFLLVGQFRTGLRSL